MAEKVPIRAVYNGADTCGLSELQDGEVVGVEHGGLGACTLTTDGVLLGNTQGAVQVSSALTTNGQLLIGGTSGPAVANVAGTSNEVEITNGDGTITVGLPATVSGLTCVGATCLGGTLQTAAQANVTSVGTLSSLTISGDVIIDTTSLKVDSSNNRVGIGTATPSHLLDVEGVANVATCIITPIYCVASQYVLPAADGSAGQVMCTDGSGGIAFATNTPSSPGGSDTYVQFNDGSSFGGSANFTWDDTTVKASNFCTAGTATLATVDINAGAIDGTTIGAASAAAITGTTITGSGNASFDGGTFIFNESGADKDFRIEGDTAANLFITDASVDRIGIGTATPSHLLDIEGVGHASTCFVSADLCATTKVVAAAICMGGGYALPTSDGTAGYILCTDGSGAVSFAAAASSGHTIAEDGSTLADRTCLNFCGSAVTVTDCSATDSTDVKVDATGACMPIRVSAGTQCYACLATATIAAPCLQCDSAPKLGGDLDVNGNSIISASNGNIPITPNGSGIVIIDGICHPIADGSAGQLLCTDGSAALKFATVAATSPGGSDTYVQFNNSSAFGGSANLTWDDTTLATTAFTATGDVSLDGGSFVFNESGADKDFRIEGDSEANLFITDASTDRIGIGTATPSHLLDVEGVANVSTCIVTPKLCIPTAGFVSGYTLPSTDGSAGTVMCTDGSGALGFATVASTSPGGSDTYIQFNNSSAFGGSANLTWDDTTLATTAFTATGNVSLNGGTFVFNESGADKDFRIEGDTEANLFITDASVDRIGIGTATPSHLVDIEGVAHAATCFVSADLCATTKVVSAALCVGSQYALPAADGSAGQLMCTDGSGALAFASGSGSGADPGSTNTWTADQTFNDNVKITLGTGGDADLYYDGTNVVLDPSVVGTGNFVVQVASSGADPNVKGLMVESSSSTAITIGSGTTVEGMLHFADSGAPNSGRIVYTHNENDMYFATAATERMRIDAGSDGRNDIIEYVND